MNDKKIITGIQSGDENIIKSFYKQHYESTKYYILANGGTQELAEDIFQEALLILYLKIRSENLLIHTSIEAYFIGICKNLWKATQRKEQRWMFANMVLDNHIYDESNIEDVLLKKEKKKLFDFYFTSLKDNTKQIWKLCFEGKNTKQIATNMKYSEAYVRKIKYESKKTLKQKITANPIFSELLGF